MDLDGADKARQLHLLELVMDEVADGGRELEALGAGREVVPVDVDGHYMVGWLERSSRDSSDLYTNADDADLPQIDARIIPYPLNVDQVYVLKYLLIPSLLPIVITMTS